MKKTILFALAALGLGFFLFRGRSPSVSQPAEAPAAPPGKSPRVEILTNNSSPVDLRQYQNDLNRERARDAQARALGLKSLEFKTSGDTVSVPLVFVPRKIWCQGGDLDTMRHASQGEANKDFVITLEGMGSGGKNPALRTSLKELSQGLTHTFTLPRPKQTSSYGLYICTDSRHENSCQRKGLKTHAQLSEQLAQNPAKTKAQDHIFFFQNLLIDGQQIEVYRSDDFSPAFQTGIGHHLGKRGVSATSVQAAWKANNALKSAPTDIRDGKIILSLPYNDPRCIQSKSSNDSPGKSPVSL